MPICIFLHIFSKKCKKKFAQFNQSLYFCAFKNNLKTFSRMEKRVLKRLTLSNLEEATPSFNSDVLRTVIGGIGTGTSDNPFTWAQFDSMFDAGTWNGGYVGGEYVCSSIPDPVVVYGNYGGSGSYGGSNDYFTPYNPTVWQEFVSFLRDIDSLMDGRNGHGAPKNVQTVVNMIPPIAVINGVHTTVTGSDIHGNEVNHPIIQGLWGIFSGGLGVFKGPTATSAAVDWMVSRGLNN